jgi:hypothetical protein
MHGDKAATTKGQANGTLAAGSIDELMRFD